MDNRGKRGWENFLKIYKPLVFAPLEYKSKQEMNFMIGLI